MGLEKHQTPMYGESIDRQPKKVYTIDIHQTRGEPDGRPGSLENGG